MSKFPTLLESIGGEVSAVQAMKRPKFEIATAGKKPPGTKPRFMLGLVTGPKPCPASALTLRKTSCLPSATTPASHARSTV